MKRIYFFILAFLFLSPFMNAQSTYHKMLKEDTTTWQHFGYIPGVSPNSLASPSTPQVFVDSYAAIDTISFNGTKYKKFYLLNAWSNQITYGNKSLAGYLREDTITKRIYYRENAAQSELLLYDFSLNVNDSVFLTFPNQNSYTGYYRVDSIVMKNEIAGPRKHFYYRKHVNNWNPTNNYFENIESIGSTYHTAYIFISNPYYMQMQFSPTCSNKWSIGLSCKHDGLTKKYKHCSSYNSYWNMKIDSCAYWYQGSGIKTNDWDNLVKIGPNPGNEQLVVIIEQSFENINCVVTDMAGKQALDPLKSNFSREKNSFIISTKDLSPGVYIVQVKLNETVIKKPVIIQH